MAAAASEEVIDALKLELKLLNAAGGIDGRPIEFVMADDGSDAQKGVVAATKLIQDDKVTAILGPFAMFVSSPVGLLAEKAGVPIIYLTPKSPADTTVQKYTFAVDYTVMGMMAMSLQMMQETGLKKWVGFAENMPGSAEQLAAFASMGSKLGLTFIKYDDTWDVTEMDFSGVVTKIAAAVKKEGAEALYIGMDENQAPYICKGLRDLGITVPIYTTANVGSQRLFALGPAPVEGLVFMGKATMDPSAIPDSAPSKAIATEFVERFNAEYGKNPGLYPSLGYDAFAVLVDALKRGGTEQTKLRDAIEATNELVTVGGLYTFSPTVHDGAHGGMFQYTVKDGKFVYVKTVELAAAPPAEGGPTTTVAAELGISFKDMGNNVVFITDTVGPDMVYPLSTSGGFAAKIWAVDATGAKLADFTTADGKVDYSSVVDKAVKIMVEGPTGGTGEYAIPK
jgi:branched-chain amino acid transport system substrate-binding protein